MMSIAAGKSATQLIQLAYRANQPLLLVGKHGVGKDAILAEAAHQLKIDCLVRDLSLIEAVDLTGLPFRDPEDGRTRYAPPAFLPKAGRGLLVFTELNRAPRWVQAPCLTLLTDRTLGDYALPPGWLPVAAVNPPAEDYEVDCLDPALRSRFCEVRLVPSVAEWVSWACGRVHPRVVDFVARSPKVFDDPTSNPRAWTYASGVLREWETSGKDYDLLLAALAGLVDQEWAVAFLQFYRGDVAPLSADQILGCYQKHRRAFRRWVRRGRLDLVTASLEAIKRRLRHLDLIDFLRENAAARAHVSVFLKDLPADLRDATTGWMAEHGLEVSDLALPC